MRKIQTLCTILFVVAIAQPSVACVEKIADPELSRLAATLADTADETGVAIARQLETSMASGEAGFCVAYTLGRYYTRLKQYETARVWLTKAEELADDVDLRTEAPWNVVGFTYLQEGNYDAALAAFEQQLQHTSFAGLEPATQMKVLNNSGYTALQLGRYDEAISNLESARDLGSGLAERNLEVARSIVGTLQSGDVEAPGVFSTVLRSVRDSTGVSTAIASLASNLGVDETEISVFRSTNDYYALTLGAYVSYPKAEKRLEVAKAKGLWDAYITSVAEWVDVTADFAPRPGEGN